MKGSGLWILFLAIGTALLCFCFCLSPISGGGDAPHRKTMDLNKPNRKLMDGFGNVDADDYATTDPVPSSKAASLRPGPIQHGTPLMPYIPKPAPPGLDDPNYAPPGSNDPNYAPSGPNDSNYDPFP